MNDINGGLFALIFLTGFLVPLIFAVVFYVLGSWFLMGIFRKAGVRTPAVAWIPVYNAMVFAKLADTSPWIPLILIGGSIVITPIPILGAIVSFVLSIAAIAYAIGIAWRISVKFGKEPVGWTIFGVLLSLIWLGVLGLGSAQWRTGPENGIEAPFWHKWGAFFRDTTTWGGVPYQGYDAA